MKKILTVLLAAAMMVITPVGVFADENVNEITPTAGADGEGTVKLKADIVSNYTVKLPKVVDVTNKSTTVDIYAKGDVDGGMKIVFSENTGTHQLADASSKNTAKDITVSFGNGINGSSIQASYSTAKDTMTIGHGDLPAGSWSCDLPIVIKLEKIAAAQ